MSVRDEMRRLSAREEMRQLSATMEPPTQDYDPVTPTAWTPEPVETPTPTPTPPPVAQPAPTPIPGPAPIDYSKPDNRMGIVESLQNKDPMSLLPFVGGFFDRSARIQDLSNWLKHGVPLYNQYGLGGTRPATPAEKEKFTKEIEEYLVQAQEIEERGQTIPAKVAGVVLDAVPYMIEFASSGGARKLFTEAGEKAVGYFAGKLASKTAGAAVGALANLPAMGHRIKSSIDQYESQGDTPGRAAWKGFLDTYIESFTEMAGGGIKHVAKAAFGKIPGSAKMVEALKKYWPKSSGTFNAKMEKIGFHGVLEEMSEEDLGRALRYFTGLNTLEESIPTLEDKAVELLAFSVIGGGGKAVEKASELNQDRKFNRGLKENLLNPDGAFAFQEANPLAAAEIAAKKNPSRSDFKKWNLFGWSAAERSKLSTLLNSPDLVPEIQGVQGGVFEFPDTMSKPDTTVPPVEEPPVKANKPYHEMTFKEFDESRPPVEGYMYHGSPEGDIGELDPYYHTQQWDEGIGVYVTDSRDMAEEYAKGRTAKGSRKTDASKKGKINYVKINPKNVLDMDAPIDNDLWEKARKEFGILSPLDAKTNGEALQELRLRHADDLGSRDDAYYAIDEWLRMNFDATVHTEGKKAGKPHRVTILGGDIYTEVGKPGVTSTVPGKVVPTKDVHKEIIKKAISEGKNIPKEVLDEYPDLVKMQEPPVEIAEEEKPTVKESLPVEPKEIFFSVHDEVARAQFDDLNAPIWKIWEKLKDKMTRQEFESLLLDLYDKREIQLERRTTMDGLTEKEISGSLKRPDIQHKDFTEPGGIWYNARDIRPASRDAWKERTYGKPENTDLPSTEKKTRPSQSTEIDKFIEENGEKPFKAKAEEYDLLVHRSSKRNGFWQATLLNKKGPISDFENENYTELLDTVAGIVKIDFSKAEIRETKNKTVKESLPVEPKGEDNPWVNASIEDEDRNRWYGTRVSVSQGGSKSENPFEGIVVGIKNKGELVLVKPDGYDTEFRIRNERVSVTELKDAPPVESKKETPVVKEKPKVSGIKNPYDFAEEMKAQGIDRQTSWSKWIQETSLNPGMDAKDWYKIYDLVTKPPAKIPQENVSKTETVNGIPLDEDQTSVYRILTDKPVHIDEITKTLGWTIPRVSSALGTLELLGIADRESGMRFRLPVEQAKPEPKPEPVKPVKKKSFKKKTEPKSTENMTARQWVESELRNSPLFIGKTPYDQAFLDAAEFTPHMGPIIRKETIGKKVGKYDTRIDRVIDMTALAEALGINVVFGKNGKKVPSRFITNNPKGRYTTIKQLYESFLRDFPEFFENSTEEFNPDHIAKFFDMLTDSVNAEKPMNERIAVGGDTYEKEYEDYIKQQEKNIQEETEFADEELDDAIADGIQQAEKLIEEDQEDIDRSLQDEIETAAKEELEAEGFDIDSVPQDKIDTFWDFIYDEETPKTKPSEKKGGVKYPSGFKEDKSSAPTGNAFANQYAGPSGTTAPAQEIFDLSEITELAAGINEGKFPGVVEQLGRKQSVEGQFSHDDVNGVGTIRLRADIAIGPRITTGVVNKMQADQIIQEMLDALMETYGLTADQIHVRREPIKKDKKNIRVIFYEIDPKFAAKVLSHEVGHLTDWIPDKTLKRGNILGHIGSLNDYVKGWLEGFPGGPGILTNKDRARLRRLAKKFLSKDVEIEIDEEIVKETKLTPQDVLDIWNSVVGSLNPDLLLYIKGLSSAEKKSIVKDALRGVLSPTLDRFTTKETIKTGNKIKKIIPGNANPAEIAKKYKELIEEEVKKRQLLSKEQIMGELKALTKWWNPFDVNRNADYTAYRHKPTELYAEAVSVLLNDPEGLRKRAPMFYDGFFGWLDSKPAFQKLYTDITNRIRSGGGIDHLTNKYYEDFQRGNDKLLENLASEKETPSTIMRAIKLAVVDTAYYIKGRAYEKRKQGTSNPDTDAEYSIEDAVYSGAARQGYSVRMNYEVVVALRAQNLEWIDLDFYMLHDRVINERNLKLNPRGTTPEKSKQLLAAMEKRIGADRFKVLKEVRRRFWEIRKEYVVDPMIKSKMFSPELEAYIRDNEHYATFEIIKYLDKEHGSGSGAKIYHQVGTLSEAAGPATATFLKDLALIRNIAWNTAKRDTIDLCKDEFPEVTESKKSFHDGRYGYEDTKKEGIKTVYYMHKGKPVAYDMPDWLALEFDKEVPPVLRAVSRAIRFTATPFRMAFTTLRAGFQIMNVQRDASRTVQNLQSMTYWKMFKSMMKALPASVRANFGKPDKIYMEMLKNNELISVAEFDGLTKNDKHDQRLMSMFVNRPRGWKKAIRNPITAIFHGALRVGATIENIPKIAGHRWLKENCPNLTDREIAHIVRTRIGSPPFLTRGYLTPITNNLLLFSNAAIQGWRYDFRAMRDMSPSQRAWMLTKYYALPKIAMWGLSSGTIAALYLAGGGGEDDEAYQELKYIEKIYAGISEYNMTNYIVVPLGIDEKTGESQYLRFPQNETGRFASGIVWKLLNAPNNGLKTISQTLDYTLGQVPGWHAGYVMAAQIAQFLSGKNPYDEFRNRNVIPEVVFEANGIEAYQAMAKHLWASAGGTGIYKFDSRPDRESENLLDKANSIPFVGDILSRFVGVSDYGLTEKFNEVTKPVAERRAKELLLENRIAQKTASGKPLTAEEQAYKDTDSSSLKRKIERTSKLYGADAYEKALLYAGSTKERDAISLEIVKIEGPEFRIAPMIETDIVRNADALSRPRPIKGTKEDPLSAQIAEYNAAKKESIAWMKARNLTAKEVLDVYETELRGIKTPSTRAKKRALLRRSLNELN